MSIKLESDSAHLEAWLSDRAERQPEVVRAWKDEGKLLVMQEMRARVPVRTGFLRESITAADAPDGFMVYPTAPYAAHVEYGTRPHTIFPRGYTVIPAKGFLGELILPVKGGVLHWTNEWGADIFAAHVHHPGFPGRFFVQRTFEFVSVELRRLYAEIVERILG
jgi:hypothetical protein